MPCTTDPDSNVCPCNYGFDDKPYYYTNNIPFWNNLGGLNGAQEACGAGSPLPKAGYCEGSNPSLSPAANDICGTTAGRGCWNAIFCDYKCDGTAAGCSDPTG